MDEEIKRVLSIANEGVITLTKKREIKYKVINKSSKKNIFDKLLIPFTIISIPFIFSKLGRKFKFSLITLNWSFDEETKEITIEFLHSNTKAKISDFKIIFEEFKELMKLKNKSSATFTIKNWRLDDKIEFFRKFGLIIERDEEDIDKYYLSF